MGQIALANVSNLQGLEFGRRSGLPDNPGERNGRGGRRGKLGVGQIQDSSLEGSNVNISSEFSSLIIAQRAFEADSKAVTTFDTVTQDTMNMIH